MWFRRSEAQVGFDSGAVLVIQADTGRAFRLDDTAAGAWDALEYAASLDDLAARLIRSYAGSAATIRADLERLLGAWVACGLATSAEEPTSERRLRERYLHLLKRSLVGAIYPENALRVTALQRSNVPSDQRERERWLRDIRLLQPDEFAALKTSWRTGTPRDRAPLILSHTLVGLTGLDNIERCAETVFGDGVPGDFLEAGVLAGGAAIFMRGLQRAHGEATRRVWVADSFVGLPLPSAPPDRGLDLAERDVPWLSRSLDDVLDNFERYDLLDEGVEFLPGWFQDTLPAAPIDALAILRIDADLYQSTFDGLNALYGKVSAGGFVIVDDYGLFEPCRRAVDEFRAAHRIAAPLRPVDSTRVFWRVPG